MRRLKIQIITIVILSAISLYGQDSRNPNVELPDFVITGSDVITLQKAKKIEPPIISTISEEFIKPVFNPEELDMKEPSNPLKEDLALFDPVSFTRGYLKAGAGLYSLPEVTFGYTYPFSSGIAGGYLTGINRRADVDYSDMYGFGGGAHLSLFADNDASFLPGTHIRFEGDYGMLAYKTYASLIDPKRKRELTEIKGGVNVTNLYLDYVKFGAKINNNYTSLAEEGFSENLIDVDGFAKLDLKNFDIGVQAKFKKQIMNSNNPILFMGNSTYLGLRPTIGLMVANSFKATFGFDITNYAGKNEITPYGGISLMLDRSLTLYALYSAGNELVTSGGLIRENRYFNPYNFHNSLMNKGSDLKIHVKYEYEKYFQIDAGAGIMSADNIYYYTIDPLDNGLFNFASTSGKGIRGEINFLFHTGPYGIFYASGIFTSYKDNANYNIPYKAAIKGEARYAYSLSNGLTTGARLLYVSERDAFIPNSTKIPSYFDLGLDLSYKVSNNFEWILELGNLLNSDNYIWYGYKELPINVTAGLRFRW